MKVRILGTSAGGGLPQWNCGCAGCDTARLTGRGRTQDGLAITGDGSIWYLVNASADLRVQLQCAPELAPARNTRAPPLGGVLLTSGELDHTLGLLTLREAAELHVYATPAVWAALPFVDALSSYTAPRWHPVVPGRAVALDGGLEAFAFAPGAKRPRYAGNGTVTGTGTDASSDNGIDEPWTVAYRFTDGRTGGVLVYAPGLARWSPSFSAGLDGAHVVLLDGTFATTDELPDAAAMGHLSIQDSLGHIARQRGPAYVYTHLNNTNPYARPGHAGAGRLADAGARIAIDGELIQL